MSAALADLDMAIMEAFRSVWSGVMKATTGAQTTISATAHGYHRSAGSFVTDGFDIGDEITVSGFPLPTSNGLGWITYVSASDITVRRDGVVLVPDPAGPAVTIAMGLPAIIKLEGDSLTGPATPSPDRPWIRETYIPGMITPASLRSFPAAMVRQRGSYWLTVNYPQGCGREGVSRLRGKIEALIYPAARVQYNGQVVRVLGNSKKQIQEEQFVSAAVAFQFTADAVNPA